MRRLLTILAVVLTAASLGWGQTGKVEQTVMQMERDWGQALVKADVATLDRILADDWFGQGPPGGSSNKAGALADLKSGTPKYDSVTPGEMKVRVFGDVAVVTGTQDVKSSYKGKDTSGHYVWTDVFVKRQGKWQAIVSQWAPAS
jgi:ketosteroid isomerase-like protein